MSVVPTWPAEAPRRSAKQRREALAQANLVRTQRARLKADLKEGHLKEGRRSLAALIAEPPDYLASAKLTEVLGAVPRCGSVRVARLLEHCRVSPNKTIGGLSPRQRRELVAALQE